MNRVNLIEPISVAAKSTANVLHQGTQLRKFFALAEASEDVQTATKNSLTDKLLFGWTYKNTYNDRER